MSNNRFTKAFERIAGAFHAPTRSEMETDYLNRSVSLTDLERRQREIARGKFSTY